MKRHMRDNYYVVGEGILTTDDNRRPTCERPSTEAAIRKFRFSRLGPEGQEVDVELLKKVAAAMTVAPDPENPTPQPDSADPPIPAGFTYLGQFVDHDLTLDNTARALGEDVTVAELLQGRSPALDLDSLYGRGPRDRHDDRFYAPDGLKLKVGVTAAIAAPAGGPPIADAGTNVNLNGFDLPRVSHGSSKAERQAPLIPDPRNDENLAVAQTHLAFIRFHNRVIDRLAAAGTPSTVLFEAAREQVVRHYQWMLRTDFLPRIIDRAIVDDVFTRGRRFFEVAAPNGAGRYRHQKPGDTPTMPIEFSVAAFRLGHSQVRAAYNWNRIFKFGGALPATLPLLFTFSGTSGNFTPGAPIDDQEAGTFERLPTNWIADFRRLYDFTEANRSDLVPDDGRGNVTQRIDTLVVNPLAELPLGSFGGQGKPRPADSFELNLTFRNLVRANMVKLASGQQLAEFLGIDALKPEQLLAGDSGAALELTAEQEQEFTARTPLWFYILREAELNSGRLTGVGGQIVAETFHRAMEGSRISIVRDPSWRPSLGPDPDTFRMVDLLLFAFEGRADLLNPLGETAPTS